MFGNIHRNCSLLHLEIFIVEVSHFDLDKSSVNAVKIFD